MKNTLVNNVHKIVCMRQKDIKQIQIQMSSIIDSEEE